MDRGRRPREGKKGFMDRGSGPREGKKGFMDRGSGPREGKKGHYYPMLLDENGDGRCDAGVDMAFAGSPDEIDAVRFVMRWALSPAGVAAFAGAQTSYCEWQ